MKTLLFLFATLPINTTAFISEFSYSSVQQKELWMCFQAHGKCACCDVFFGECRKETWPQVFEGECTQAFNDAFIYEIRYKTEDEWQD